MDEIVPILVVASKMLDVVSSVEKLAESVQELSTIAKFKNNLSKVVAEQQKEVSHPCYNSSGSLHVIFIN